MAQNVRFHRNGIVECIACGTMYELTKLKYRTTDYGPLNCLTCGEPMDHSDRTFSPICHPITGLTEATCTGSRG